MGAGLQHRSLAPARLTLAGRSIIVIAMGIIGACSSPPAPRDSVAVPVTDPARQPDYLSAIRSLATMNAAAQAHFAAGRRQQAAALVTEGEALSKQLLGVSRPNLAAMEAVSDRDQIYGDLLLSNRHAAYARQIYQRNAARWKHWRPQTENTLRRLHEAESAIARCDQALPGKNWSSSGKPSR